MTKKILHNQSLIDFVLNHCGCLDSLLLIATTNNLSITDELLPGQNLIIPNEAIIDKNIRDYYYTKNIIPACGFPVKNKINYVFPYGFPINF